MRRSPTTGRAATGAVASGSKVLVSLVTPAAKAIMVHLTLK